MSLDKKNLLKIWLNPGFKLTIFRGTGPWANSPDKLDSVTLFGKRGIKVNLENSVLTRLIGFVEKRGNAFCTRLNRFLMRLNNQLCCTSILHFVCSKVS